MKVQSASIVLAAASANNICLSQTPTAAAGFTINGAAASGGVATLDVARRVLFTTAGAEAGKTATIRGTDRNGNAIYESLALVSIGTSYTLQDFKTVTSIGISSNAAAGITVGTNGIASTRWLPLNPLIDSICTTIVVDLGGVTANVSVEATLDEVNIAAYLARPDTATTAQAQGGLTNYLPPTVFAIANPFSTVTLTALTANAIAGIAYPLPAVRLTVNSGAATAGPRILALQSGIV